MQHHDFSLSAANTPVHHPTNRRKHGVDNFSLKMHQRFLLAILFTSDFFADYFFCWLLCQTACSGATRYSLLNANEGISLINRHKKFLGEIFNVTSAMARKGGDQGLHAIKKRGERFSTSLATARRVAARDGTP
ncbi:hypothetical protein [Pectobacterium peruviense]|uniref:hypothetical protein n=1 Tax=Pectobacterium peruviense TaxID=2066479 RepID=UPI0011AB3A0D|nr:hypothetical protein [Pectobacterium peruviense]